MKLCWW